MRNIRDCNVCVVGGAGFLGSHLVDYLVQERNCTVMAVDNLITGRREFINRRAQFVHADIAHSESYLYKLFKGNKVRYVFNYAAEPYVPLSFKRPLHVMNVNAMGALQVMNAAHEAGCEGILQVSSAELYGSGFEPIDENGLVCPHSSYGASKAAVDYLVQTRWREAHTPCIALRQFNCVGERETHPYIVPELISQIDRGDKVDGRAVVRLGNNSTRDFQYAGDAVRMSVELLERGQFGEVYNMGSEDCVKVYDLAHIVHQAYANGKYEAKTDVVLDQSRVRPWEIWYLRSNNAKLYATIDERPKVTLFNAVVRTIQYYLNAGRRWVWE